MVSVGLKVGKRTSYVARLTKVGRQVVANRWLYVLIAPAVIYLIVFNYFPMYGIQIAFKDYKAVRGIEGSAWVGLKHFRTFFSAYYFGRLIGNTLLLNVYNLLFQFPIPIILAVMLNNLRSRSFKKLTQTAVYIPHFVSTVVLAGMLYILLSPSNGIVNHLISALGGQPIYFMNEARWFRSVYIISSVWQNAGWSSILYIAALAGVDPELYEAATIDGATLWQRVLHIDVPHIIPTATMMLILSCGGLMNSAIQKALLFQTGGNMATSDIIGTYVYTMGLGNGQFSYTSAIGLFVNVINFALIVGANSISNKMKGETLF
ncbi:MAG: ABC transporter permease subunit [Oscillospiraceae bacterium]|jgi:putative aldouronate transport system permease protein|nr:ABC transporter permease subunit [Oscillospiraceae bacterium]